ncbi:hypothetical protein B7494_g468 [Chlorociboria aeruginascens]|nr:hypothetical protein B7494_g468 [Chlorociboria aeruginascens]
MPEKVYKKFADEADQPQSTTKSTPNSQQNSKVDNPQYKKQATVHDADKTLQANAGPQRKSSTNPKSQAASGTASQKTGKTGAHESNGSKAIKAVNADSAFSGGLKGQRQRATSISKPASSRANPQALQKIASELEKVRKTLPIWDKKADIRWALRNNDILLLIGETGSGKSTQVPQFLHTEPWCKKQSIKIKNDAGREEDVAIGGMIAITQPRRIAATTLAQRVAREAGSYLGNAKENVPGKVGYAVRFDSNVPQGTKIKFVTEGILLQEMLRDPHLRQYSAIIVDEIHERSIDVDLIAGFLRQLVHGDKKGRGGISLKVVIMSATMDLGGLEAFFAKPETQPDYQPGNNHGRTLAPHLLDEEQEMANNAKLFLDEARRSSTDSSNTFSSWEGFSSSDDGDKTKVTNGAAPTEDVDMEWPSAHELETGIPDGDISENGVVVEYVEGRAHEVRCFYELKPTTDYMDSTLKRIISVHISEPLPGDILVFLTGQEEIETLQTQLEYYSDQFAKEVPRYKIMPLYGSLPAPAQQEVFEPVKEKRTRKIVLATNIAETSVTVSGVRYVVDCGKSKVKQYRPKLGMESLLSKPISMVSAIQRRGRAGREMEGKCFRIYTQGDFESMEEDEVPEILRSDVIEAVLKMKARGVQDVLSFPLMDSPDIVAMEKALLQLHLMGALNDEGDLTEAGKKMAIFPLPAGYGRVLIAAAELDAGCLLEAIDIISCLTADAEVFLQAKSEEERDEVEQYRNDLTRREGDILTYLNTMQHYASENVNRTEWCKKRMISTRAMKSAYAIRRQLRSICLSVKLLAEQAPADPQPFEPVSPEKAEVILKSFLKAFATKTAVLAPDGSYLTTQGRHAIAIHPSSVMHGVKKEAIMFLEHVYTAKSYAKKVSAIQANWLVEALDA